MIRRGFALRRIRRFTRIEIRGFTLVEILVALAIVAIALAAGMRALTQAADGATALKARTLALWVAQNVLARAQLAAPSPQPGVTTGEETQAAARFQWRRDDRADAQPRVPPHRNRRRHARCAELRAGAADRLPRQSRRAMKPRGFTLVEVLVALAILALIGVLAYRAMAALADGESRLAVETSRWTTLDAFFARVEGDLRAAVPRDVRHGAAREPALRAAGSTPPATASWR